MNKKLIVFTFIILFSFQAYGMRRSARGFSGLGSRFSSTQLLSQQRVASPMARSLSWGMPRNPDTLKNSSFFSRFTKFLKTKTGALCVGLGFSYTLYKQNLYAEEPLTQEQKKQEKETLKDESNRVPNEEKELRDELTQFIFQHLKQIPADNYCKRFSTGKVCNKAFKGLAISQHRPHDDSWGSFSTEPCVIGNHIVRTQFAIWKNQHKYKRKIDEIETTIGLIGVEAIKDFEDRFKFTEKVESLDDDYTECHYDENVRSVKGIPTRFIHCSTNISYRDFIKEMDDLELEK